MRHLLVTAIGFCAVFAAQNDSAALKFVNPLDRSQAIGALWLEVTTDAQNVDRIEFTVDGVLAGVARKAPWRVPYDFGTSLGMHKISAKAWMNGYKTSEEATVTTAALSAAETMNVDLVEVPMSIHAEQVVKPQDVVVKENGVTQEVRSIQSQRSAEQVVKPQDVVVKENGVTQE